MSNPFLILAMPLLSSLALLSSHSYSKKLLFSFIAFGGVFVSAILSLSLLFLPSHAIAATFTLFNWLPAFLDFDGIDFALRLDSLSITMCLTVSFVSLWIILYSLEYMAHEEGKTRFFAVVNLFVFFMLLLVLADNLLLLFVGWEGVGICSYLLIGFYIEEPKAEAAAMKAFLITRIGDVFLLIGIILCFILFGTLSMHEIIEMASVEYPQGATLLTIAAFCILGGAVGKSAQLPLQSWLADAMWGPTPVSALIHAATMVTAGVYLIARLGGLFFLSTEAEGAVLIVGLATMLFAGLVACLQHDMKKVLAYSTMSQLGYMFVALGLGAYQAAVFHLFTHAFFKALLFLSAGVIGHSLHTYDLRKMGGLKAKHPLLFWLFTIGALNLVGLPLVTAGFFSKEWIMSYAHNVPMVWWLGVFGAFLTGLYTFRMWLLAFFGKTQSTSTAIHAGWTMLLPLIILAIFSLILGWLETPHLIASSQVFSRWLDPSVASIELVGEENFLSLFAPSGAALFGLLLAMILVGKIRLQSGENIFHRLAQRGGGFDMLYNAIFVIPFRWLSSLLRKDAVLLFEQSLSLVTRFGYQKIYQLQSGKLTSMLAFFVLAALVVAFTAVIL